MTQPIFRLVENTFYLEDNFESSEDYRATQLLLKLLAEEKGYIEENYTFNFKYTSDEIYNNIRDMGKKLIYKDTEYHTYSCTGKKTELKRLEYKENQNLEDRFKMQRLYGDELPKYKDEDIEIDKYIVDDGMNLIYVIEVYEKS